MQRKRPARLINHLCKPLSKGPWHFGRNLGSEDGAMGSIHERLVGRHVGDPLACGEAPRPSLELPDQELGPCEGLKRGQEEA